MSRLGRLRRLYARFRTWQLRHCGAWGGLRVGTAVWCLLPIVSTRPDLRVAGDVVTVPGLFPRDTLGIRVVAVRIYRDSPLGNDIMTAIVPLSKIEYRSPSE